VSQILVDFAIKCIQNNISIIPCNFTTRPIIVSWTPYQNKMAMPQTARRWFSKSRLRIAVVGGPASGGLEILDFRCNGIAFADFSEILERKKPGLLRSLYCGQSPTGEYQLIYRCGDGARVNTKLASFAEKVQRAGVFELHGKKIKARKHDNKWFVVRDLIEIRGIGGYCIVAPSKGYKKLSGDLFSLPILDADTHQYLIRAAQSLNQWFLPADVKPAPISKN